MKQDNDNIDSTTGKKRGRGAIKVSVVLGLLLLASLAGVYFLHQDSDTAKAGLKDANSQISKLEKENAMLKIELDTTKLNLRRERDMRARVEHECDSIRIMFPLYIDEMEVSNADAHGNLIGGYGRDIAAANSMYLMPRIKYFGLKGGMRVELLVRLYDRDGKLVTGTTSPAGYSYSYRLDPIEPGVNSLMLSGWGGADRGHFEPGTYRYEVWLGDMCLKQKSFTLR